MINEIEMSRAETGTNYFENFDLWTKMDYYAFKYRLTYPNLFFHHFSKTGIVTEDFSKSDINEILTALRQLKNKLNGLWGYLSCLMDNKAGLAVYKFIANSEFFGPSTNLPCIQDALPYDEKIEVSLKVNEIYFKTI